jgi:hypothetical protein
MQTTEKRKKLLPPLLPQKKKKLGPSLVHADPFIGCMELLFAKTICHHFGPGLMAWQHPKKRKKKKFFPPPSSPKRENSDPLISAY